MATDNWLLAELEAAAKDARAMTHRCPTCSCPTDSEIDAAIEAATANLTTSRGTK